MFALKIFALGLFSVVYSSVSSDDTENSQQTSYKFNHPPQSESYHSIPVAIIYDEPASTNQKFSERVATTYYPRFKAQEIVTEQNRYEGRSSTTDNDDFTEEDERRVKRLRKILRKARLRLRADVLPDDDVESATTLRSEPEDTVTAKELERTKNFNTVYKEINRNVEKGQKVSLQNQSLTENLISTEKSKIEHSDSEAKNSTLKKTLQETSGTVKEVERTKSLQTFNQGRQRGQKVTPLVQTEAPSSDVIDETTSTTPNIKQTDRKQIRGRGSVRYRNYEEPSTSTIQTVTTAKVRSSPENEEENYAKVTSNVIKSRANIDVTTEQSVFPPERENYPSSEQPKLTNNRPGPRSGNRRVSTNETPQGNRQRVRYYSQSSVNSIEKDTNTASSILEAGNYPSTMRPKTSKKNSTETPVGTTEEENYPKVPIIPLQLKTNKHATTVHPITTTEEENYPKLPIVPLQQQLKTNEKTTVMPFTTTEKENLLSVSTTDRTKYLEQLNLKTNEAVTTQPLVTTEEENYPKTVKPWIRYREEVSSVQQKSTTQHISPSTPKPQTRYQQREQEDTQVQTEVPVPKDVNGRVITLKSSFDVATLSPLAKSVLQKNNKAKVIFKVQKTETPSDVTDEPTTLPTTIAEITSTTETIETTEKLFINEIQTKPHQQKSRNRLQNQNEEQIPVIIVYDNSDLSIPENKRNILRTKSNPINIGEIVKPDPTVKPVDEVPVHRPPKTGNVTQNVNAELRTRGRKPVVPILDSENHVYAQTGKFNYRYESGDGTNAFQEGILKPFDDDVTGEAVRGGFSYTDKDGNDFSLSYTADENGYRPVGAHLPTPPPIPPAIARALAHLATKSTPNPDEVTESSLPDIY